MWCAYNYLMNFICEYSPLSIDIFKEIKHHEEHEICIELQQSGANNCKKNKNKQMMKRRRLHRKKINIGTIRYA